uniref:Tetraspanin-31 n=2 Tax=Macrostomum lignano TaxID=282301 RepID=A0A1I8IFB5_9PLAT
MGLPCGGFTCTKTALTVLNGVFMLVSIALMALAGYSRMAAVVTSINILSGLIVCGVFLFFVSLLGLLSARLHNQAMLFFYIIVLFLLFLLQFAIACACLAVNSSQQETILEAAWGQLGNYSRGDAQRLFQCCGFRNPMQLDEPLGHPPCAPLACCSGSASLCCTGNLNSTANLGLACPCQLNCLTATKAKFNRAAKLTGSVGLLVSFAEIAGVWLAIRYRNLKDPRADLSAFL